MTVAELRKYIIEQCMEQKDSSIPPKLRICKDGKIVIRIH